MTPHPAKFSPEILHELDKLVATYSVDTVLDPFAGTGRIHQLRARTVGIEIEHLWARYDPKTIVGDALHLPFRTQSFDAVITSPTYGNRMADHHEAAETCRKCLGLGNIAIGIVCPRCKGEGCNTYKRLTYRHQLGQELHPRNSGQLQWGVAYRKFHEAAWLEATRVLRYDGLLMINVSNHQRDWEEVDVVGFHIETAKQLGLVLTDKLEVKTRRMRFGANREERVPMEQILVFRNPVPE